ncbi:MAG: DUF2079 domain-containing protein, partial [Thaumarchaeota archaeon]|nr:DUF2079 domain-containing protein [Nitrososphaerota archaeon]
MLRRSDHRYNFAQRHLVLLGIVIGIGFLVRFYYFPYEIPVTLDGFRYFLYAMDVTVLGHLPTNYTFPNNGWSLVLSFFFSIFRFESYVDYTTLQRVLSVVFSVLTAIPTYFLCRKYFSEPLAVIGSLLFVLTPRVIQNSLGGITDPLFIFLTTTSVTLFLSGGKKTYISFFVLALSSLVRYESLLLIIPFTTLFAIRFRGESKIVLKSMIVFAIFALTLMPLAYLRVEATGQDGLLSHVLGGAKVTVTNGSILNQEGTKFSLQNGLSSLAIYLGVTALPVLFVFIPFGIYCFFKKKNYDVMALSMITIFMLLPAIYAYGRGFQDTRYVFVILPIASVVALYSIEKIAQIAKKRNIALIAVFVVIIILGIGYLDFKKADHKHDEEAIRIAKIIHDLDGAVNEFAPESTFVETAALHSTKFPALASTIDRGPKVIPFKGKSIEEGIKNGKERGLSYLVADNLNTKPNRNPILNDVFYHEEKYPYLVKIFDSSEHGYKYHVKV